MSNAPSRIYINNGGTPADWVQTYMVDSVVAADGSFTIDSPDGPIKVERSHAVFEFAGQAHACAVRLVQEKLKQIAGDHPAVASLPEPKRQHQTAPRPRVAIGDKPLKLRPIIGTPPAPQFLPIGNLQVDDTYQRSIEGGASQTLIRKIAETWDWRLCLPLLVSRRSWENGAIFVIDGQHRMEGAALRGDIPHLPAVVFDFDDPKAEADLFIQANRSRRAMSKLDDFHAAVVAGEAKLLAVNDVVTAAGLVVGRIQAWQYWKPGEIVFVTAIQRALSAHGKDVAVQALSMIARAFDGTVLTGMGPVFEGLCTIITDRAKAGNPIDAALMEVVLAEVGIAGWKEAFEGTDTGPERSEAMLRAITAAYAEAEAE